MTAAKPARPNSGMVAHISGQHPILQVQLTHQPLQQYFLALWQQFKSSSIMLQKQLQQQRQSSNTTCLERCLSLPSTEMHSYIQVRGQQYLKQSRQ